VRLVTELRDKPEFHARSFTATVDDAEFPTAFSMAEYLSMRLLPLAPEEIESVSGFGDLGLWSWLTVWFFDVVCPPKPDGTRAVGPDERYIPEVRTEFSFHRYYRHRLAGPYRIYQQHGKHSFPLLHTPVHKHSGLYRAVEEQQDLMQTPGVIEAIGLLYFDAAAKRPKPGAIGSDKAGSLRRFTEVVRQLLSLKGTASATLPKHECTSISYTAILRCLLESLEERPRIPVGSYIRSYAKTLANLCGEEQPKWVAVREPVKESCNVFRFLYISRREDALHTPMLAGLLDPKSSHNQGSTFLSSFLKLLACSPTLPTTERKKLLEGIGCEWEVELERKVRTGRLDIFLCCRDKGILIVVENKLDAGEGQNQLYRYNEAISTRRAEFPHQILVLLTISGSPATSAGDALVHLLSYKQILTLVSEHCDKLNPGPMKDMVDAYLTVLEGIMLQPGTASRAGGRSKIPCPDHSKAALNFLDRFIAEWARLPGSTKYLIPVSDPDKTHKGKYQGIWVWPKDLRQFQNQQLLIIRIATPLGNESMMGLYVGLRWRNTEWSNKNEKWVQLPEARDLLGLSNNIYRGPNRGMQNGQWFAICERLEYPRTDGALASALRFHERELHQLTASKIHNIWALCGDRVLVLNKKLLSCQRA
jgi:hypothetical protein